MLTPDEIKRLEDDAADSAKRNFDELEALDTHKAVPSLLDALDDDDEDMD